MYYIFRIKKSVLKPDLCSLDSLQTSGLNKKADSKDDETLKEV